MTDDNIIQTQWGPGHIMSGAKFTDGRCGWLVDIRKAECKVWPFEGDFVFKVVECVNAEPSIDMEMAE